MELVYFLAPGALTWLVAEILSGTDAAIVEMNISCPNVKHGGLAFGTNAAVVEELTSEVKKRCKKPRHSPISTILRNPPP